ncbi:glycosyltransferase [Halobacteria archaeon AArc-m2/3/4]|uniref:Glycosyltransferase n=1 Tax=Natronoglomus mannanivorans TaxID=2979990 RepID=A0ABT2QKA1_9EURY|nr:glycosyltransferase [Halobacteria archaeon AArc-m2/3/4]
MKMKHLKEYTVREQQTKLPLVSVILPTYEDHDYLERSIKSVHSQTYGNIELVIVDGNGSEDLCQCLYDSNWIQYYSQKPKGVAAARNHGIDVCEGNIISFIDADDRWLRQKTELQVREIKSGADIVYSDEFRIKYGKRYKFSSLDIDSTDSAWEQHFIEGGVPLRTVSARRECFNQYTFWEDLKMSEDPHLWTRMFKEFTPRKISEPLAVKHMRADSLTSDYETLYQNELKAAIDLANQYEELRKMLKQRLMTIEYTYAINAFKDPNNNNSGKLLSGLVKKNHKLYTTLPLFVVDKLPVRSDKLIKPLEIIKNKI